jgi:hypothetical protein
MRNIFLTIILGVSISSSGLVFTQGTASKVDILKKELTSLNLDNPEADLDKNLAAGDKRFIGVYGYTYECPGLADEKKCFEAAQAKTLRMIEGTSDNILSKEHGKLIQQAVNYALRYNRALKKKLSGVLLTKDEVIRIAEDTAKSEGFDIRKYNMTGCHYEYIRKDGTWTVLFELKPPTPPGGHFLVWINDKTKEAKLMHGE